MAAETPLAFPAPVIRQSAMRKLKIAFSEHEIVERPAIESASGKCYELGRILKEAIYGQVCHAILLTCIQEGVYQRAYPVTQLAIKVYSKARLRAFHGKTQENPVKELSAMQFIGTHPNIMGQLECCQDKDNVYSMMDFCDGGEVYDLVETNGAMPEATARLYFRQVLDGLGHLHALGIAHRDMSLENLMYNSRGECIIIDLGMCLRVPLLTDERTYTMTPARIPPQGVCGKKNYIAPEVLENAHYFDPTKVDVWALGIILFIMLTGVPPIESATPLDQRYRMVCAGLLGNMLEQWHMAVAPSAVDLISRILRPNPDERLTLKEIYSHPWMQQ